MATSSGKMQTGASGNPLANYAPPLTAAERSARSVFVGNIPYEATEEQLKEIFIQAGPVVSFRLVYDRETGKPKGYGFCEYQDVETAQSAMRNLNNFDFYGRPLRVGVAAGEQNKEELKSMQQALGGPPVESPYGEPVDAEKAPEAISKAVASLPPEQMFELMKQMKLCIQNNPNEARNMLLQNPQLAYALLQAQIVMKIVDPQVAVAMLNRQNEQIPPLMPSTGDASSQSQAPPTAQSAHMGPGAQPMEVGGFSVQQPGFGAQGGGGGGVPPSNMASMPPNNMPGMPATSMPGMPATSMPGMPPTSMQGMPTGMNPAQQAMDMMGPGQRGPPGGPMGPAGRGRGGPMGLLGDRPLMQDQMGPGGPMQTHQGPVPGGRGDMGGPRGHIGGGPMLGMPGRPGDMEMRADHRGGMGAGAPGGGDPRHPGGPRMAAPQGPGMMGRGGPGGPGPGGPVPGGAPGPAGAPSDQDQEKAALIMQVLQLSDQQIAMLPPEQRQSILILKEQIARSAGQGAP